MPLDRQSTSAELPEGAPAGPTGALICAIMAPSLDLLKNSTAQLAGHFGAVRRASPAYSFDRYSSYYAEEMGTDLIKQLLWFGDLVDLFALAKAKQTTMKVERSAAENREGQLARRVNIDPGLVTVDSLVLASTKYSGHRIGIGAGLYAETTLLFRKGSYQPMPWTYMDYKADEAQDFLLSVRKDILGK